jgi:hypothetical protein
VKVKGAILGNWYFWLTINISEKVIPTMPRWWVALARLRVSPAQDGPAQPLALPALPGTMQLEPQMDPD